MFYVLLFVFTSVFNPLQAHLLYNKNLVYECYELIDLGETDICQEQLSRSSFPLSLGPRINQKGHVIGNDTVGGFILDRVNPKMLLERNGSVATVYDINDKGLILASMKTDSRTRDWYLWPYSYFCQCETLLPLDLKCLDGRDVNFRSFNDKGVLVGSRTCQREGGYKAVFYSPDKGIQDLSCSLLFEVNNSGNMAGYEAHTFENTPLLYHFRGGWSGFSDDRKMGRWPQGSQTFQTDMAIASDNTLFGSFFSKKYGGPYIYGYAWNPCEQIFRAYDLGGMQISAVNSCHVLVGSLGGQAVISNNMGMPVTLASRVKRGAPPDICLIEATDINDLGEIVGYGKWGGSLHLFLLEPIR